MAYKGSRAVFLKGERAQVCFYFEGGRSTSLLGPTTGHSANFYMYTGGKILLETTVQLICLQLIHSETYILIFANFSVLNLTPYTHVKSAQCTLSF